MHYEPALEKHEDMAVAMAVVEKSGRTLKCLHHAYRASHSNAGGAAEARGNKCGGMDSLMPQSVFETLPSHRRSIILALLRWTGTRERHSVRATAVKRARLINASFNELQVSLTKAPFASSSSSSSSSS